MKDDKYFYTQCLEPRKVFNRYTKQSIIVPCGKCVVCESAKASANTIKCRCESHFHDYLYFVTLTYADEYLPTASLVPFHEHYDVPNKSGYTARHFLSDGYFVTCDQSGEILGEYYPKTSLDVGMLVKKCNVNNPDSDYRQIPILYKPDVQLFLKRLRKYLKQFTDERIRYYCCGEYGPVHFRPHFHLLLWFEKEETASSIIDAVRKCWRFGRVDVSRSFGQSCSYVAKYVNGNCNLPYVFRLAKSKPFSTHSQHLGSKVFTCEAETFEETEIDRTKSISIGYDGQYKNFDMWRSVKHSIFPKCQGFASKSEQQRCYAYSIYDVTRKWTQTPVCIDQARNIASYLMDVGTSHESPMVEKMLNYFYQSVAYPAGEHIPFTYDKMVSNIYRQILMSKHFLLSICKGDRNKVLPIVRKIGLYYKTCDMELLKNQLKMEEENEDFNPNFYFPNLWINHETIFALKDDSNYRLHKKLMTDKAKESVKHKKLNDLNNIFNYL